MSDGGGGGGGDGGGGGEPSSFSAATATSAVPASSSSSSSPAAAAAAATRQPPSPPRPRPRCPQQQQQEEEQQQKQQHPLRLLPLPVATFLTSANHNGIGLVARKRNDDRGVDDDGDDDTVGVGGTVADSTTRATTTSSSTTSGETESATTTTIAVVVGVDEAPSAQQRVLVVRLALRPTASTNSKNIIEPDDNDGNGNECDDEERDCKVVVRIWRKARRWWTLHRDDYDLDLDVGDSDSDSDLDDDTSGGQNRKKEEETEAKAKSKSALLREMAASELAGYEIARRALLSSARTTKTKTAAAERHQTAERDDGSSGDDIHGDNDESRRRRRRRPPPPPPPHPHPHPHFGVRVPAVLYSSIDDIGESVGDESVDGDANPSERRRRRRRRQFSLSPWAAFEYVGNGSQLFSSSKNWRYDATWSRRMVTTRREFGYANEPHLRWGGVPVDSSEEYALLVLRQVVMPVHRYCIEMAAAADENDCNNDSDNNLEQRQQQFDTCVEKLCGYDGERRGFTYGRMLALYRKAHGQLVARNNLRRRREQQQRQEEEGDQDDDFASRAGALLGKAIERLAREAEALRLLVEETTNSNADDDEGSISVQQPVPVLCHMDYQPQNLLFARYDAAAGSDDDDDDDDDNSDDSSDNHNNNDDDDDTSGVAVASVLDWEEAAYADGRFDLLLLCRKVCANAEQANSVWETYRSELPAPRLGPIEPWLKLETVHSLLTLLLQYADSSSSTDAGGGGGGGGGNSRSPWETRTDLRGKIEREFGRLKAAGWDFFVPFGR